MNRTENSNATMWMDLAHEMDPEQRGTNGGAIAWMSRGQNGPEKPGT